MQLLSEQMKPVLGGASSARAPGSSLCKDVTLPTGTGLTAVKLSPCQQALRVGSDSGVSPGSL